MGQSTETCFVSILVVEQITTAGYEKFSSKSQLFWSMSIKNIDFVILEWKKVDRKTNYFQLSKTSTGNVFITKENIQYIKHLTHNFPSPTPDQIKERESIPTFCQHIVAFSSQKTC